jgi:hypothetical protein
LPASPHSVVFALSEDNKFVILGVPEAAWEYMKDGKTHTFDLNAVGVPVSLVMFGGKTRGHVLETLGATMKLPELDTKTDYGVKEDERQLPRMRANARAYLADYVGPGVSDDWLDGLFKVILNP